VGYQVGEEDQSPTMAAETGMRTPEAACFAAVSEMCGALLGSEVLDRGPLLAGTSYWACLLWSKLYSIQLNLEVPRTAGAWKFEALSAASIRSEQRS
jgi:hypothetical protein